MASPAGSGNAFSAVSCGSAKRGVAVGVSNGVPLAELWNGTSWSTLASAVHAGNRDFVAGVSCPTARRCIGVGLTENRKVIEGFVLTGSPAA